MAVKHLKSKTRAFFEKAFPERQIYHRSGGSVRYVSISPWRQAMMAGGATLIVGWCLFATVAVLLRAPAVELQTNGVTRQTARLERELRAAKAREQTALSLLETRTKEYEDAIGKVEDRMTTLKRIAASLQGQDLASATALTGDNVDKLVDSSIEEGDARRGRAGTATVTGRESAGVRARTDNLIAETNTFLDIAEDEAVDRIERGMGVIRMTGVSTSRILRQPGMGGPLIEVSNLTSFPGAENDPFTRRILEVEARLSDAKLVEARLHALPLGAPVDVPYYRETSGFGYREDPFNRRKTSFHEGADLAAYYGAPIIATAPGKVTFAGTRGTYGRVVEIDHGDGFKTRYGHMNSIAVRANTQVAIGQKVGTMGSTGRSTGPHLHYEIFFDGKHYDPIKFLKAGKHVHKG
jgi:murein DD-endopeptidase MepM/ murein hydrolase activator NlpD